MENNEQMIHKESVQEGGFVSQKIPKVQIEILVGGKQEDKEKVGAFLDELNKQINAYKEAKKRIRVLYHLRPDTMTEEEQNDWLRDKANSVYMIFAPKDRSISIVYIKSMVNNIKKFEEGLKWVQEKAEFKSRYVAKKAAEKSAPAKETSVASDNVSEKPKRKPRQPKAAK